MRVSNNCFLLTMLIIIQNSELTHGFPLGCSLSTEPCDNSIVNDGQGDGTIYPLKPRLRIPVRPRPTVSVQPRGSSSVKNSENVPYEPEILNPRQSIVQYKLKPTFAKKNPTPASVTGVVEKNNALDQRITPSMFPPKVSSKSILTHQVKDQPTLPKRPILAGTVSNDNFYGDFVESQTIKNSEEYLVRVERELVDEATTTDVIVNDLDQNDMSDDEITVEPSENYMKSQEMIILNTNDDIEAEQLDESFPSSSNDSNSTMQNNSYSVKVEGNVLHEPSPIPILPPGRPNLQSEVVEDSIKAEIIPINCGPGKYIDQFRIKPIPPTTEDSLSANKHSSSSEEEFIDEEVTDDSLTRVSIT